jgi:hypothetical protein
MMKKQQHRVSISVLWSLLLLGVFIVGSAGNVQAAPASDPMSDVSKGAAASSSSASGNSAGLVDPYAPSAGGDALLGQPTGTMAAPEDKSSGLAQMGGSRSSGAGGSSTSGSSGMGTMQDSGSQQQPGTTSSPSAGTQGQQKQGQTFMDRMFNRNKPRTSPEQNMSDTPPSSSSQQSPAGSGSGGGMQQSSP